MIVKLYKFNYKYNILLSLGNKDIRMKEIEVEIEDSVKAYNNYAITSTKNKKRISKYEINEQDDLLIITLESENPLPIPVRGIKYFTQLLIKSLQKDRSLLLEDILRKKAFFRTVYVEELKDNNLDKEKEVTNFKLEKMEEIKQVQEDVSIKDDVYINEIEKVKENIDLVYLKQLCKEEINILMDFLISSEISENDRKKICSIEKILKGGE